MDYRKIVRTCGIIVYAATLSLRLSVQAGDTSRSNLPLSRDTEKEAVRASGQASIKAAAAIEKIRAHLEEWGTVNVSQPLLYPVSGQFSLGPASDFPLFRDYYLSELTNVTAGVGQLSQSALVASANGTFNASQFTNSTSGTSTTQSSNSSAQGTSAASNSQFPLAAPATATPTDAPASQAKGFLDQSTFHKPGELLGTGLPNGNSPHSAVNQAATDKITELLIRNLANPSPPADGAKLYLAIFQVTSNPGWRTLKGYMADVFINWEYGRRCRDGTVALSLSNSTPTAPTVVAMLPLVDAQNMELRNGQRELTSLLAALAASGALNGGNAAGKGVLDYVKSYQKDAASRNSMPVVNSYSTGCGMGFRFAPSFVAISDPAKKKSPAANILIPTSFPVLAVLSMRKEEATRQSSQWPEVRKDGYNNLVFEENFRWLIRDGSVSLLPWRWQWPLRRNDEGRRLKLATLNDAAFEALTLAKEAYLNEAALNQTDVYTRADYQLLRTDYKELDDKTAAKWHYSPLPDDLLKNPKPTEIVDWQPKMIDPTSDTKLTIQGNSFKVDGLRVFLGGQECSIISIDGEKSIVALFKASNLTTRLFSSAFDNKADAFPMPAAAPGNKAYADLVVVTKTGAKTKEVEIDLTKQLEQRAAEKKAKRVQVTRDAQGKILSIDFSGLGDNPSKEVLDAVGKIFGVSEAASKLGGNSPPNPGP